MHTSVRFFFLTILPTIQNPLLFSQILPTKHCQSSDLSVVNKKVSVQTLNSPTFSNDVVSKLHTLDFDLLRPRVLRIVRGSIWLFFVAELRTRCGFIVMSTVKEELKPS